MAREIRWSLHASRQLEKTLLFWNTNNHSNYYSQKLYSETTRTLKLVSKFPLIGRQTDNQQIRKITVDKKYGVFYSFDSEFINVQLWRPLKMNFEDF